MLSCLLLSLAAAPQGCQPVVQDLMAGQHYNIGEVTISNTGDTLRVDIQLDMGGVMHHDGTIWAVQIYAGFGPPPTNSAGNVAPGLFPYKTEYPNGTISHTELIPLSDFGAACGDTVQVAVHCEVSCNLHPDETAWMTGNVPFGGGQWGWYLDYDLCCTANSNGDMDLGLTELCIGRSCTVSVTNAQPGELVYLFRNQGLIVLGSGRTVPALNGTVMDLTGSLTLLSTQVADAAGVATASVRLPATIAPGTVFGFQAVAPRSGAPAGISEARYAVASYASLSL